MVQIGKAEWAPDFGPAQFVPRWGATVTGVRKFLIAFNINVLGTKEQAHRMALNLREQGRGPGQPGRLKAVQGKQQMRSSAVAQHMKISNGPKESAGGWTRRIWRRFRST